MKILTDFLVFWGLRKPKIEPTELECYRDAWKARLVDLAMARLMEQQAKRRVEALVGQIDLLEALMEAHPGQQFRLQSTYTKAKEAQGGQNF